jgi:hypothetical protein
MGVVCMFCERLVESFYVMPDCMSEHRACEACYATLTGMGDGCVFCPKPGLVSPGTQRPQGQAALVVARGSTTSPVVARATSAPAVPRGTAAPVAARGTSGTAPVAACMPRRRPLANNRVTGAGRDQGHLTVTARKLRGAGPLTTEIVLPMAAAPPATPARFLEQSASLGTSGASRDRERVIGGGFDVPFPLHRWLDPLKGVATARSAAAHSSPMPLYTPDKLTPEAKALLPTPLVSHTRLHTGTREGFHGNGHSTDNASASISSRRAARRRRAKQSERDAVPGAVSDVSAALARTALMQGTSRGKEVVVLWFRNDLRLQDNAALVEAMKCGLPVLPLFIFSPEDEGRWGPGQAARLWISRRYEH